MLAIVSTMGGPKSQLKKTFKQNTSHKQNIQLFNIVQPQQATKSIDRAASNNLTTKDEGVLFVDLRRFRFRRRQSNGPGNESMPSYRAAAHLTFVDC